MKLFLPSDGVYAAAGTGQNMTRGLTLLISLLMEMGKDLSATIKELLE